MSHSKRRLFSAEDFASMRTEARLIAEAQDKLDASKNDARERLAARTAKLNALGPVALPAYIIPDYVVRVRCPKLGWHVVGTHEHLRFAEERFADVVRNVPHAMVALNKVDRTIEGCWTTVRSYDPPLPDVYGNK